MEKVWKKGGMKGGRWGISDNGLENDYVQRISRAREGEGVDMVVQGRVRVLNRWEDIWVPT